MLRTALSTLLCLSLTLSQPLSAVASKFGRIVKTAPGSINGSLGGALGGTASNIKLAPLTSNTISLRGTLPTLALPAPQAGDAVVPQTLTQHNSQQAGAPSDKPIHVSITGDAAIADKFLPAVAPEREIRARQPVRFTGRIPARGVSEKDGKFAAFRSRVLKFVGQHWQLPTEDILQAHDVLLIGESHSSRSSVQTVSENIEELHTAGVRVIGIEGLKRPDQQKVNDYLAGKTPKAPNVFPSRKNEFRTLLKVAKEKGMRVKALGLPLSVWTQMVQQQAAAATGDPAESFGADLGAQLARAEQSYEPGFNEAVADVVLTTRNRYMASELADELDRGEKAVAVVGNAHVEHAEDYDYHLFGFDLSAYGSLAGELKQHALNAFSVTLTGGLYERAGGDRDHAALMGPLNDLAQEASDGLRTFLRTSPTTAVLHAGGAQQSGRTKADSASIAADGAVKPKKTRGLFYGVAAGLLAAVFAPYLWGAIPGGTVLYAGLVGAVPLIIYVSGVLSWKTFRATLRAPWFIKVGAGASAAALAFYHKAIFLWAIGMPLSMLYAIPAFALLSAAIIYAHRRAYNLAAPKSKPLSGRRLLIGLLLGAVLGTAPYIARPWAVPVMHQNFGEKGPAGMQYEHAPNEFNAAIIRHFEKSASGRKLLDNYRDVSGEIRLPLFYMVGHGNPHYVGLYDAVFMPTRLKNITDWDAYVAYEATTLYHELWHGVESRREFTASPAHYEHEIESYLRQNLHLYDVWSKDINAYPQDLSKNVDFAWFVEDPEKYLEQSLMEYGDIPHAPEDSHVHGFLEQWKARDMQEVQVRGLVIAADRYLFSHPRPWVQKSVEFYNLALTKAQEAGNDEWIAFVTERRQAAIAAYPALGEQLRAIATD
jgi:hypothetical protein